MKYRYCLPVALFGSLFSLPATSGPILTEVLETMMEAQSNESLFIGHVFGVDDSTTLQFNFNVDPDSRSFSYSLIPNQTFLGLPMTLNATGAFEAASSEYQWTSSGSYDGQIWTSVGFVEWIGDPHGTVSTTVTWGGKEYKVNGEVTWDFGGIGFTSSGTYTFTDADGKTFGPYKGTDQWVIPPDNPLNGRWEHTAGPNYPEGIVTTFATGITPSPDGGAGTSQVDIHSVPEPNTLLLFMTAAVAMTLSVKAR